MARAALTLVTLSLWLILSWNVGFSADNRPALTEKEAARVDLWWMMLYERGHFLIDGTVVDEQGKPVPAFTIQYPHGRTAKEIEEIDAVFRNPTVKKLADIQYKLRHAPEKAQGKAGRFQVDAKYVNFNMFPLRFSGTGYYDGEVLLESPISDKEYESLDRAIVNGTMPKEILVKRSLRVVMRKKGEMTKLERWTVNVEFAAKGDRKGVQIARQSGKMETAVVQVPAGARRLPPKSIFLSAKSDGKGAILLEKTPHHRFGNLVDVPAGVKLVMNDQAGDGFINFKAPPPGASDRSIHYDREPIQRAMAQAPATGYRSQLDFTGADLTSMTQCGDDVMFYFKLGGLYGRGRYLSSGLAEDKSKVTVVLELELQPDGSRNLETGE